MNLLTQQVKIYKALSDKTRLEMVQHVAGKKELSCKEISALFPKLSQPTLSHHFSKLVDAEILTVKKDGINNFYSLNAAYLRKMGVKL